MDTLLQILITIESGPAVSSPAGVAEVAEGSIEDLFSPAGSGWELSNTRKFVFSFWKYVLIYSLAMIFAGSTCMTRCIWKPTMEMTSKIIRALPSMMGPTGERFMRIGIVSFT